MPERTKEELERIYNDLLEFRTTLNWLNSFGDLWPTPMNGKTWEQEKNEFWNREINAFKGLILEGTVTSCEVKSLCEKSYLTLQERKNREGFWNHVSSHPADASEFKINGAISLDQYLRILERVLSDNRTEEEKGIVNQVLDDIGTSACEPRACIENTQYDMNIRDFSTNKIRRELTSFRG